MASVFTKLLLSSVGLMGLAESALAYYNADDHEAQIRRSCNRLRDSEERWGCFSGNIRIIEQIRRRERAERVYRPVVKDFDYGNSEASFERPRPKKTPKKSRPVVRETPDEDYSPVMTPKKEKVAVTPPKVEKPADTTPAPQEQALKPVPEKQQLPPAPPVPQPAKPAEGEGSDPKLIGQDPVAMPGIIVSGDFGKPSAGDEPITDENAENNAAAILAIPGISPVRTVDSQHNADGSLKKGDRLDMKPAPEAQSPAAPVAKPIAKNDSLPVQAPKAVTGVDGAPASKKESIQPTLLNPTPEPQKPVVAKPAIPEKFEKTCATNVSDLEKKPHLREAMKRILGANPLKRGEEREFAVRGNRMDPAQCLGLMTQNLRNCRATVPAESMQIRATNGGQLQSFVNEKWVNVKTCSDGEKIETTYEFSKAWFTFNMKTTLTRKNGKLNSSTRGILSTDPGYVVNFANVTVDTQGNQDSRNSALVARRENRRATR